MADIVRHWGRAAQILGMSRDKLERDRKKYGDRMQTPWWPSEAAVIAWYERLIAPPPAPPAPEPRRRRAADVVFDADALRRELKR